MLSRVIGVSAVAVLLLFAAGGANRAQGVLITEHPVSGVSSLDEIYPTQGGLLIAGGLPTAFSRVTGAPFAISAGPRGPEPQNFTVGPNGDLWYVGRTEVEQGSGTQVERMTYGSVSELTGSGLVERYRFPSIWAQPETPLDIAAGADGALWITDLHGSIDRLAIDGTIKSYPIPSGPPPYPVDIVSGPDGALWFTELGINAIGRITTSGEISQYPLPGSTGPYGLTVGPDSALWFTEQQSGAIGRITTTGEVKRFSIPENIRRLQPGTAAARPQPRNIVAGPDGALWFTDPGDSTIGRITTAGEVAEYPTPRITADPDSLALGPEGDLWFTETEKMLGSADPRATSPPTRTTTAPRATAARRMDCRARVSRHAHGHTRRRLTHPSRCRLRRLISRASRREHTNS